MLNKPNFKRLKWYLNIEIFVWANYIFFGKMNFDFFSPKTKLYDLCTFYRLLCVRRRINNSTCCRH